MAVMAAEGRCRNGCGAEGSEGGAACCAALAARERSRSAACAAIFLCITSLRSSATMRSSSSAFGCARLPDIEEWRGEGRKKRTRTCAIFIFCKERRRDARTKTNQKSMRNFAYG